MTAYKKRDVRYPKWPAARDILPDYSAVFDTESGKRKSMPTKPLRYNVEFFDGADIMRGIPTFGKAPTSRVVARNVSRAEALRIIDRMNAKHKRLVFTAESTTYVPTNRVEY